MQPTIFRKVGSCPTFEATFSMGRKAAESWWERLDWQVSRRSAVGQLAGLRRRTKMLAVTACATCSAMH